MFSSPPPAEEPHPRPLPRHRSPASAAAPPPPPPPPAPAPAEPDEFEKMFQTPAPAAAEPKREPGEFTRMFQAAQAAPHRRVARSCAAALVFPRAGRVHANVSGIPGSSDRGTSGRSAACTAFGSAGK